jgi:hypothetical protein
MDGCGVDKCGRSKLRHRGSKLSYGSAVKRKVESGSATLDTTHERYRTHRKWFKKTGIKTQGKFANLHVIIVWDKQNSLFSPVFLNP